MSDPIVTIATKSNEKFLHRKTGAFDFSKHSPAEVTDLIRRMRASMRAANGIGLSANQIGLPWKVFVAQVPDSDGTMKFYAIFNPQLEKMGGERVPLEEGCLSVPGVYGEVLRYPRVTLLGQDRRGKPLKIKAWGLLAHVFQHETDHLDGKLFIELTKNIRTVAVSERLAEREKKIANPQEHAAPSN
ncbi:MAG: peptide deformylase [Candidatus Liptonbacteria bacterium]|nr:peptide deformylase [Candidatus Liptonbacteria bacterium]